MTSSLRSAMTAGVVVCVMMAVAGHASAGPIEQLPGRWTGWGKLTTDGGNTERVKCIATYFSENGGHELRHNLRCASVNYKIDAVARLNVKGGRVTGEWQERKYSNSGAVNGQVVGDGISVNIIGQSFEARMTVATTKCSQTMNISPKGTGVSRIALNLTRC